MPPSLRKRKDPEPPPPAPAKKAKPASKPAAKKAAPKAPPAAAAAAAAEAPAPAVATTSEPAAQPAKTDAPTEASGPPDVGATIDLEAFGGPIQTNEGADTTLAALVKASRSGVVLFTYPKASTPGCTTQACLFRDSYAPLTATGLDIFGLSTDSPKANTTFKERQKLPYPLLCDGKAGLIKAIGFKKSPSGTQRGVFAVGKDGNVLLREAGGPAATVDAVKKLVEGMGGDAGKIPDKEEVE